MNRSKFAFAIMFSLLGLAGIGSAAYVQSTIAQYRNAAPCYQLTGLAGLLQATHFISSGGCTVDLKSGGCRAVDTACTIDNPPSGGDPSNNQGLCQASNNGTNCVCVKKTIR